MLTQCLLARKTVPLAQQMVYFCGHKYRKTGPHTAFRAERRPASQEFPNIFFVKIFYLFVHFSDYCGMTKTIANQPILPITFSIIHA